MRKKFTKKMVNDYAEKLLIGLTKEECNMVLEEFSIIDETINKIYNDYKPFPETRGAFAQVSGVSYSVRYQEWVIQSGIRSELFNQVSGVSYSVRYQEWVVQ